MTSIFTELLRQLLPFSSTPKFSASLPQTVFVSWSRQAVQEDQVSDYPTCLSSYCQFTVSKEQHVLKFIFFTWYPNISVVHQHLSPSSASSVIKIGFSFHINPSVIQRFLFLGSSFLEDVNINLPRIAPVTMKLLATLLRPRLYRYYTNVKPGYKRRFLELSSGVTFKVGCHSNRIKPHSKTELNSANSSTMRWLKTTEFSCKAKHTAQAFLS